MTDRIIHSFEEYEIHTFTVPVPLTINAKDFMFDVGVEENMESI